MYSTPPRGTIFSAFLRGSHKTIFSAADRMVARLESRIGLLATPGLSRMGRMGLVEGTFEIVERPYIIVYRVDESRQEIVVLSIVHGARDR